MSYESMKTVACAAVAAICAAVAYSPAHARSLIHYFDFDTLRGGALAYQGADKGTSPADFTFKQDGSAALGYTAGAFGSGHAFYTSNKSSIWLGDGSASLGCGTVKGFTISFWLKTSSSHGAWTDFFGFRVGGCDYRLEYTTTNSGEFTLYSEGVNEVGHRKITEAAAGSWTHVALVFTPNSTNTTGTASIYVGGKRVRDMVPTAGNLQQIFVGARVRQNGADRCINYSNTGIDELAVFDYPATAEQVKWLAKYKPAQPANGPGRAMPLAYLLDRADNNGLYADNSGCGTDAAYKWMDGYANWCLLGMGALDSSRAFVLKDVTSFRVDGASATEGLGASLDSGMTLSFWVKAPASVALWSDFMSFRIGGNQYKRFEWNAANPLNFTVFGSSSAAGNVALKANAWQNVCMVWNPAVSKMEFYLDGEKTGMTLAFGNPTSADVLKSLTFGPTVFDNNGGMRLVATTPSVLLDGIAVFNHSFSPAQIKWLANNVPCLPSLDATNLVRTVSADGVWAGGRASWTAREWDGEAWTDAARITIYPTLEDTEVEVSVAFADGVTLTNDTFVTPKRLVFAAANGAGPSAAALKCAEGSRFAPESLEIGNGLQLSVPLYRANVDGTLVFGAGSKIVFDVSNYDGGDVALVTGGIALPAGESDALAHFGVTDDRFALSLSDDGKTVYARLDNVAATATWTGAGDGTSLGSAANWECRNGSGTLLAGGDALPCELTRVIVCSASGVLNVPAGTAIPWQYLRFEADDAALSQDCDWRGFGVAVTVPSGKTVDLNGHKLYVNGFDGEGAFTSGVYGGELHIDVPEGTICENGPSTLAGSLKLVKEGAGTLLVSKAWHTYAGGTVIDSGVLKIGLPLSSRGAVGVDGSTITVNGGGMIDVNGSVACHVHNLVMNGGTMKNGAEVSFLNWTQWATVSLADDSTFDLQYGYGFLGSNWGPTTLDLCGHKLTVDIGAGQDFLLCHTTVKNGTVDVASGGYLVADNTEVVATNADFRINCALKVNVPFSVRNYEAVYKHDYNSGTAAMNVYGVFKPMTNYYYGCTMQNGSTMDLRAWPYGSGWPMYSRFTSGKKDIGFASGTAEAPSIVNVNLAGRTDLRATSRSENPYIVTWDAVPSYVDFVLDAATAAEGYKLVSESDGLRLTRAAGTSILLR